MSQQVSLGKRAVRLALGASAVAVALVTHSAHAAVIVVDFSTNAFSTIPFNIDGFYLNVVTGATGTSGSAVTGWDLNPYYSGSTGATPVLNMFPPTGGGTVSTGPLSAGTSVSSISTFSTAILGVTQTAPGIYTFGFRFLNEATSATNYGYFVLQQLTAQPLAAGSMKFLRYAYENTGLAITTPVPEPSTALMMVGGLLAAAALRKRLAARNTA